MSKTLLGGYGWRRLETVRGNGQNAENCLEINGKLKIAHKQPAKEASLRECAELITRLFFSIHSACYFFFFLPILHEDAGLTQNNGYLRY